MMCPDDFPITNRQMFLCVYIVQQDGVGDIDGQAGNDAAPDIDGVVFLVLAEL